MRIAYRLMVMCLATVAFAFAGSSSYRITLHQPSIVAGTELKAGDYKLEVTDSKVVIKQGKTSVEAEVKVESADSKFSSTSVRYQNGDGKYRIQEIRLGGTSTKLVFN